METITQPQEKKINHSQFKEVDSITLKIEHMNAANEIISEEISRCSEPIFLLEFNDMVDVPAPNPPIKNIFDESVPPFYFTNKMYAQFFEKQFHLDYPNANSPYDHLFITPMHPLKPRGYDELYDDIYRRFKFFTKEEGEFGIHEKAFAQNLIVTPEQKERFLLLCKQMISFESVRPNIYMLVDDFMQKNPQYTCARIFNSVK